MPGERIDVQDIVSGDTDSEMAFDERCAKAGAMGDRWRSQRRTGALQLFKVISGSKSTLAGYDFNEHIRVQGLS